MPWYLHQTRTRIGIYPLRSPRSFFPTVLKSTNDDEMMRYLNYEQMAVEAAEKLMVMFFRSAKNAFLCVGFYVVQY